jgi:hypothetical protein
VAVLWVRLFERSGSIDQQLHREYRESYHIGLDDPLTPELAILFAPGVPRVNSSFPSDLAALATKPEVTTPDPTDNYLRLLTVEYSTRSVDPSRQNQDKNDSPLLQPPKVRWGHVIHSRLFNWTADDSPVYKYQDGKRGDPATFLVGAPGAGGRWPVQNSAGEAYNPAPNIEVRRRTLSVIRNEASYNPEFADLYIDHTNIDYFQGESPGRARCVQFDGERDYAKGVPFFVVSYAFEFGNWDHRVQDYSTYHYPTGDANAPPAKKLAADGTPIRVNLNGAGVKNPDNAPVVFLSFRKYPRADFNALKLANL